MIEYLNIYVFYDKEESTLYVEMPATKEWRVEGAIPTNLNTEDGVLVVGEFVPRYSFSSFYKHGGGKILGKGILK